MELVIIGIASAVGVTSFVSSEEDEKLQTTLDTYILPLHDVVKKKINYQADYTTNTQYRFKSVDEDYDPINNVENIIWRNSWSDPQSRYNSNMWIRQSSRINNTRSYFKRPDVYR